MFWGFGGEKEKRKGVCRAFLGPFAYGGAPRDGGLFLGVPIVFSLVNVRIVNPNSRRTLL